ncbi:MAG: carboxylate-amine ligase [Mycobacteriales bacterium]
MDSEALTIGVEEEYQLLEIGSGALVSRGRGVLAAAQRLAAEARARGQLAGQVQGELPLSQVECATAVCTSLDDVRRQLVDLRTLLREAASAEGCELAASGSPPIARVADQRADDEDPRYAAMLREQGYLIDRQFIAGLHVHVGVPDRDRAVAALDRVRPWLPVLVALAANSPYWLGVDTGFASYRTVHWGRWPVAGAPPACGDAAGYDEVGQALMATGAIRDIGQLYWQARLSARFPTVELRACDVPLSVADSVALTGLGRALVRRTLADLDDGVPAPGVRAEVLRAANWRAARHGLRDCLVDPVSGEQRPAAAVVAALVDYVRPALEERGDRELVESFVERLGTEGNGADRQRAAYAGGGLQAVAGLLVEETAR